MRLKLIERSAERLRFRNARGIGWVFIAIGVLLAAASLTATGASAWFALLFASACLGAGGRVALARADLTIDLLARRFDGRLGYWRAPRSYRGSTDQIERVRLRRSRRDRAGDESADCDDWDWMVLLELADWPPMVVFSSPSENAAVDSWEQYAALLQVPAVDSSGRTRSVGTADILERLDRIVPDRPFAGGRPTAPPDSGSIVWRDVPEAATIELPRGGYLRGAWFPLLFGGAFLTAGAVFLSAATGLFPVVPSRPFAWLAGILFSGIGILILGLLALGSCSRQIVREEAEILSFELSLLGRPWHTQRLPKGRVERIVRMKVPGRVPAHGPTISDREELGAQAKEVVVRCGEELVRLARGADEPTQEWLCRTLQQLVARPRPGAGSH